MGRFQDKVVIITGSSNGIGQAALLDFAKEGANVVIHGLNPNRIKETEELLKKAGVSADRYLIVNGPIQDEATLQKLINEPLKKWGKIDVLVNNAGLGFKTGHDLYSIENYDFVFAVNVRARLRLIELAIPHLKKTKGNTVGVSSTGAFRKPINHDLHTFYSTASAAFDHYMRNDTERLASLESASTTNDAEKNAGLSVYEKLSRNAVIPGGAEPWEISRVILFLADEKSKSITGASYYIDRGLSTFAPQ
uniref:Uncharacterized protein n=1 Tax=Panagrolaimus sp. PS1159 TaxID=55785 RepID=A0AC35FE26_9BILA